MSERQNDDGLTEARNAGLSMHGDGLTVGSAKYGSRNNATAHYRCEGCSFKSDDEAAAREHHSGPRADKDSFFVSKGDQMPDHRLGGHNVVIDYK